MFAKILAVSALVACAQAGVFELGHGQHATSYSSINQHVAPVAHYAAAPVAHYATAPVAHYATAPVAHYAAAPVAHYAAPVAHYTAPVAHYAAPIVKAVHQEVYADAHPQYSYEYGVQDAHTGDVKNQHEERDGDVVKGYYTLVQPDGVTRTVHYSADSHNGFNANVEYKGEPIVQKAVVAKTFVAAPVFEYESGMDHKHLTCSLSILYLPIPLWYLVYKLEFLSLDMDNMLLPTHHQPRSVVKTVAPVAHYAAPLAAYHTAPVAHYAAPVAAYHHVPAVVKTVAPVAQYAAPIVKSIHQELYPDTHPEYSYQYGVQDAHTGDVKNQHEERDGDVVKGYYTLVQPDGVTRTVHYTADSHNGFNAEVVYKGEPIVQKAVVAKTIVAAAPVYKAYHH
ncbi:PREDICTED: cuticle protein-like [Nicrophorus vespilloides]|uniref:Cuticle protein-like n=1 Tax=Nicrophorus vespilloides TaxID=110193 RepID=A0ABM1MWN9_NICVS|nr:PREDICTED: cuticle protein-like [Nicrophorus vespilloides]